MLPLAVHPPAPPPPAPARVLAFADEHRFSLSRRSVPAGPLRLQLTNIGEDDHDVRIVDPRGAVRGQTGDVRPGRLGEIRTRLSRGRYTTTPRAASAATCRGSTGTTTCWSPPSSGPCTRPSSSRGSGWRPPGCCPGSTPRGWR